MIYIYIYIYIYFFLSLTVRFATNLSFQHKVGLDNRTFYKNLRKYKSSFFFFFLQICAAHSHKNRSVFLKNALRRKCTIKSDKLSYRIFHLTYLEASKILLKHETTALFHETNQLSLELYKHHNFTNKINQNMHRRLIAFHIALIPLGKV